MKRKRAFTLLELLVVVAIISLLMTILMPSLSQTHERAKRTVCASNLHGLIQAMYLYAQNPPGAFPMTSGSTSLTSSNMYLFNPNHRTFVPPTTGAPNITADLWLLTRRGFTIPRAFICPSTTDVPDPAQDSTAYYDFFGMSNLSYGYQYQHDMNRPPLDTTSDPSFPVMADANPYIKGGVTANIASDRVSPYRGNSVNHTNREGQNVLFVDGHVLFELGPDVGLSGRVASTLTISRGRDHCYTYHSPTPGATVDWGAAAPIWTSPTSAGTCDLGSKSDACLVP